MPFPRAMQLPCLALILGLGLLPGVASTPLDDYVSAPDAHYRWNDTGARIHTLLGGVGTVLNVTSQKWLDVSKAAGPYGDIWTHQVVVVVPKHIRVRNVTMAYLTGSCNHNPSVPKADDEDIVVADSVASMTGAIAIVVFQIPNCPIIYPSDPTKKPRTEDAMIAWGWHEVLQEGPEFDPRWLARLPMTKAAMACMRAAEEYLATVPNTLEAHKGWFVAGASKRGWTTWTVGAVTCKTCPTIVGIAPLVPIVPALLQEMHRQFRAYGGWTFAFADYLAVNLTRYVDSPVFNAAMKIVDPMYYGERLARLPKVIVLSSDDEFMMMDWSNIWYDELTGESHLLLADNAEHSLATGLPEVLDTIGAMIGSIASGITSAQRPSFTYTVDEATGEISVHIPKGVVHGKVVLRHAETLQAERRDFRWVRLASERTGNCTLPDIPLPKPLFGGNCIQPIIWTGKTLKPAVSVLPGVVTYKAKPPAPKKGRWTGYWIEMFFPSGTSMKSEFHFTTPGFTWPNTLPYADCSGAACEGHPL